MSDYYFHSETKEIYSKLDDLCYSWEDRYKDLDIVEGYYPMLELKTKAIFLIRADDLEELVPIDEGNFDDIHKDFGFDELTLKKIKKQMLGI